MPRGICDHCGEYTLALTKWPDEIHHTCDCLCHKARLETLERIKQEQKKKKNK